MKKIVPYILAIGILSYVCYRAWSFLEKGFQTILLFFHSDFSARAWGGFLLALFVLLGVLAVFGAIIWFLILAIANDLHKDD